MNTPTDPKKRDQKKKESTIPKAYDLKEFSRLFHFFRPKLKHMKMKELETDSACELGYN